MPALIKGDNILFKIYDGSDSYDPIACLTSNNLSETKNIIESQTKCNPGQIIKTPGSYTYELSIEGELAIKDADQFDYMSLRADLVNGVAQQWSMEGFQAGGPNDTYYGTAYFSAFEVDAPAGDEIATFSATLVGDGETAITTTNPNP